MITTPQLGDKVEDTVSGFKGVVVSKHLYLQGCSRLTLQPKVDKDGKLPDCATFDTPQIKIIKAKAAERGDTRIGGPEKYSDEGR